MAIACVALCSCARPFNLNETLNPFYNPPAQSSASKQPLPNFNIPARTSIPGSPRRFKAEKTYPPSLTRQKLVWSDGNFSWHIRFPAREYAYAACEMKYPMNLKMYREELDLTLRFSPAEMASSIAIALLDDFGNAADETLADFVTERHNGWAKAVIPLSAFSEPPALNDVNQPVPARAFDWSQIREVRFISHGGLSSAREFIAHDLTLERR